jgi:hypothetical protein
LLRNLFFSDFFRALILIIINVLNTRGGFFTITNFLTDAHFILITKGLLDSNESRLYLCAGERVGFFVNQIDYTLRVFPLFELSPMLAP